MHTGTNGGFTFEEGVGPASSSAIQHVAAPAGLAPTCPPALSRIAGGSQRKLGKPVGLSGVGTKPLYPPFLSFCQAVSHGDGICKVSIASPTRLYDAQRVVSAAAAGFHGCMSGPGWCLFSTGCAAMATCVVITVSGQLVICRVL